MTSCVQCGVGKPCKLLINAEVAKCDAVPHDIMDDPISCVTGILVSYEEISGTEEREKELSLYTL